MPFDGSGASTGHHGVIVSVVVSPQVPELFADIVNHSHVGGDVGKDVETVAGVLVGEGIETTALVEVQGSLNRRGRDEFGIKVFNHHNARRADLGLGGPEEHPVEVAESVGGNKAEVVERAGEGTEREPKKFPAS